jgi:hypothetical protein
LAPIPLAAATVTSVSRSSGVADRPVPPGVRATHVLLVVAAVMDAAFPAIVASLDATSPDLDPWRHTLSRHAQAPGFPWMEVAFVAHGVAMGILAVALRRLPPRPWASPTALWLGAVASVGLILVKPSQVIQQTRLGRSTPRHRERSLRLTARGTHHGRELRSLSGLVPVTDDVPAMRGGFGPFLLVGS